MKKIGIIRESRTDDNRVPLVPLQIKKLLNEYSDLKIFVQPSNHRCFKDAEYKKMGGIIENNLSDCDIILGVKEIDPNLLMDSKIYIFFSHTSKIQSDNSAAAQGTPGMDKKELVRKILEKNITLIDYENIRDKLNRRYLGFGRFAGIVGCYNSINLYLKTIGQKPMQRANSLNSYDKIKEIVKGKDLKNAKIILTGDGRVAKGALEFLNFSNINNIKPNEFFNYKGSDSVFINLTTSLYLKSKDNKKFNLQHFIEHPDMYVSTLEKYLPYADMLISAHYWDPKSPKLFDKKNIKMYDKLKVIGDISCDINGSIPTTIRSSTIENPYYYIDRQNLKETKKSNSALAIMAVDNLPSELPRDSSEEFGNGIISEVIPYLIKKDDGRIAKATIIKNGELCTSYKYLNHYINF